MRHLILLCIFLFFAGVAVADDLAVAKSMNKLHALVQNVHHGLNFAERERAKFDPSTFEKDYDSINVILNDLVKKDVLKQAKYRLVFKDIDRDGYNMVRLFIDDELGSKMGIYFARELSGLGAKFRERTMYPDEKLKEMLVTTRLPKEHFEKFHRLIVQMGAIEFIEDNINN